MTFHQDELNILGLSAPIILRLLRTKEDQVISRIYGEFRNGKLEHTAALAEFTAIRSIINEITAALRVHQAQQEKAHASDIHEPGPSNT